MKRGLRYLALILLLGAPYQSGGQTTYNGPLVEMSDLRIELQPARDDQFTINLTNKMTGLQASHAFGGEGANDPEPFILVQSQYCDTPVILLTVKFPWRHALPQYQRVLETYAFRASDFNFVDSTFGPLTDIALADVSAYGPSELDMMPPIKVRCLSGQVEKPFEFMEQNAK